MTDAELIARLRDHREYSDGPEGVISFEVDVCFEAADRIEELIAERNDWESHAIYNAEFVDLAVSYRNERDAARAKLAKAVEALEQCEIMLRLRGHDEVAAIARATLAEIKSSEGAPPYGLEGESHE